MNSPIIPEEFLPVGFPKICLYHLTDPITREICYVGQTDNPERRLYQYCSSPGNIKNLNGYLTRWLFSLYELGSYPILTVFEVVHCLSSPTPHKRESELINEYWKAGHPLLNGRRKQFSDWQQRVNNSRFNQERKLFWFYEPVKVYEPSPTPPT